MKHKAAAMTASYLLDGLHCIQSQEVSRKAGERMTEKNILAYFRSPEEAEGVARKLSALRVANLSIDRFQRYGSQGEHSAGVAHFTAEIVEAADPTVSELGYSGEGGPNGRDILLTVVVHDAIHHQALRIIEEAGGMV